MQPDAKRQISDLPASGSSIYSDDDDDDDGDDDDDDKGHECSGSGQAQWPELVGGSSSTWS